MRLRWKADMALTSFLEDEDEDSPRPLLSLPEEELVVVVALSWDSLPVDIVGGWWMAETTVILPEPQQQGQHGERMEYTQRRAEEEH